MVAVCEILRDNIRQSDRLARYGGEEFAIILPESKRAGAVRIAEKLRKRVEKDAAAKSAVTLPITTSCGISTLEPDLGAPELVRRADQALYRAKNSGKNQVIHFGAM